MEGSDVLTTSSSSSSSSSSDDGSGGKVHTSLTHAERILIDSSDFGCRDSLLGNNRRDDDDGGGGGLVAEEGGWGRTRGEDWVEGGVLGGGEDKGDLGRLSAHS